MRLDVWVDIIVLFLGQIYIKMLWVYIELDFCSFVFYVVFEGYLYIKVFFSYEWGMFELSVEFFLMVMWLNECILYVCC